MGEAEGREEVSFVSAWSVVAFIAFLAVIGVLAEKEFKKYATELKI